MRRVLAVAAAVAAALMILPSMAQAREDDLQARLLEDPSLACCNDHPYVFKPVKDTPAPRGFKPVYISHYSRHGSRSAWGDKNYKAVIKSLEAASKAGILTEDGDSLLAAVRRCHDIYGGMDGRLMPRGVREHRMLAERMFHRYRRVFRGSRSVRCMGSFVPRSLVSMNSFTARLSALNPKLDLSLDTGEKFFHGYICVIGPDSLTDGCRVIYDSLTRDMPEDTVSIRPMLFTDVEKSRETVPDIHSFQSNLLSVAKTAPCMDESFDMLRFIPQDVLYKNTRRMDMKIYGRYGYSKGFGEKRIGYGEGLVNDIVTKADEALASNRKIAADLRFGHDWALLVALSRMGIEGVTPHLSIEEVPGTWLSAENLCMASNLQLIFYRNRKGETLVKFLYQEQERLLTGLEPVSGPYYRWEDIKTKLNVNER